MFFTGPMLHHHINHSKKVIFYWIPIHRGIQGNDKADSLAKAALNMVPDKKLKNTLYWPQTENQQIIIKK